MRFLVVALALAACVSSADSARSSQPPGATPATPTISAEDEPVCHEESVTGSNMTRTVCRTRNQEERDRQEAQDFNSRTSRQRQTLTDSPKPTSR